jgi:nucleotide-binding universal stress UspA family protein
MQSQPERAEREAETELTVVAASTIFDRVFVPVDYSIGSRRAVGAALALSRSFGSSVCLFHAAESSGSDEWLAGIGSPAVGGDWVEIATDRLRRFVENVAPDALSRVEIRASVGGETVRLVHKEARDWGATLLVVSADVRSALFRSTGERLVHEFELPTLILPK